MARKRIGELLLERRAITREQLEAGLVAQRRTRERLGATLVRLGAIDDEQLAVVLSEALSIPRVDLKHVTPDWEALQLMRPRFCEQNLLLPFDIETRPNGRKVLSVAMADPLNAPAIQEVEFTTGMAVQVRLASLSAVKNAILRTFYKTDPKQRLGSGEMVIFQGGTSRKVDRDGTEIITGEEVPPGESADAELEQLIVRRQGERKQARARAKEAEFVFGRKGESDVEKVEERFWALLRILARKGLITRDEFSQELDEADG
jgi:Type II secretion system (T2SS), protein E, N-terminal domain